MNGASRSHWPRAAAGRLLAALVVLAAASALTAAPAPAAAAKQQIVIGIADQKPDMFGDPRFAEMGVRHARLAIGWNALSSKWQREQLDAWMYAARIAGVEPLISFGHSRGLNRRQLPSPERMGAELRRFRARYPWAKTFATWNEANHCGEPTCHRPELVAAYYRSMRRACPSCRILAAELLDMPNMRSWVKAFQRKLGFSPKLWGLHNYLDANRRRTSGTSALLKATKGQIWFTETGGIVKRRNVRKVAFKESASSAAAATRWVFRRLVPLSGRIKRVYFYHWNATTTTATWDSALVGPTGVPRPALKVIRQQLFLQALDRLRRLPRPTEPVVAAPLPPALPELPVPVMPVLPALPAQEGAPA